MKANHIEIGILILLFLMFFQSVDCQQPIVVQTIVDGEINAAVEAQVGRALESAESNNANLVVIQLNTPGGTLDATRKIMELLENSPIPTIVFVHPPGATAWSAGTYILMSSHIAVMASGSSIGSCQPATEVGEPIEESKYVNAMIALMVHHARLHNRNETAAKLFVLENINMGPEEALQNHVIEFIADSLPQLLMQLEGYKLIKVRLEAGTSQWQVKRLSEPNPENTVVVYEFSGISKAKIIRVNPQISLVAMQILLNPLVSGLLFMVGLYLLFIGLKTPGYGMELAGTLFILLALVGFNVIGLSLAAILFFLIGIGLLLAEIKTQIGVLAIAGVICLILGSLFLFPTTEWLIPTAIIQQIQATIIAVSITLAIFFLILVYKAAEAHKRRLAMGPETLVGAEGIAITKLAPHGEVRVHGQIWRAKLKREDMKISKNTRIQVVKREGLTLIVEPLEKS